MSRSVPPSRLTSHFGFTSVQSLDEASGVFIALSLEFNTRHIQTNRKRLAFTQSGVLSAAAYLISYLRDQDFFLTAINCDRICQTPSV